MVYVYKNILIYLEVSLYAFPKRMYYCIYFAALVAKWQGSKGGVGG